ncbi:hypothetical protein [Nocardia abscessus]|uniref:hypothetical protein n=1 Tax=Nocardia abscessus TaxID=120957 RepID=UPI002457F3D4|nr:hypothetical protein [Nocardia abscessus]
MSTSTGERWLQRRHLILGWLWIVLAVPALLWWKDSVLFVILLSLYANSEASFAAHQAKKRNDEGEG